MSAISLAWGRPRLGERRGVKRCHRIVLFVARAVWRGGRHKLLAQGRSPKPTLPLISGTPCLLRLARGETTPRSDGQAGDVHQLWPPSATRASPRAHSAWGPLPQCARGLVQSGVVHGARLGPCVGGCLGVVGHGRPQLMPWQALSRAKGTVGYACGVSGGPFLLDSVFWGCTCDPRRTSKSFAKEKLALCMRKHALCADCLEGMVRTEPV